MRRFWTADEDETVRLNYANYPTFLIAYLLDRSERAVYQRAESMGLKKSEAYFASDKAGRIQRGRTDPRMVGTQFRKGQAAWNKGLRGVVGVQPECRATQFKKGRPASEARNYKPIGSLRVCRDGYLERKVTDDPFVYPARRWVGVHRLVWEAQNGPVPAGQIVVFKPGHRTTNEDEITPDRLELISRAENMRRNTYHRYPKEIALAIQLKGALQRQINKRERQQA